MGLSLSYSFSDFPSEYFLLLSVSILALTFDAIDGRGPNNEIAQTSKDILPAVYY